MSSIVDIDAVSALRESVDALIFEIAEQTEENQYKADALRYRMLLQCVHDVSCEVDRQYISMDTLLGSQEVAVGLMPTSLTLRVLLPMPIYSLQAIDVGLDELIKRQGSPEVRPSRWYESLVRTKIKY